MLDRKDILNLSYYEYGEAFTGSLNKLRYKIVIFPQRNYKWNPKKEGEKICLRLFMWIGENSFDKTNEEDIEIKDYEYCEDGLQAIVNDINKKLSLSKYA